MTTDYFISDLLGTFIPTFCHQSPFIVIEIQVNCMDNLLSFGNTDFESYVFGHIQEEERKVQTPYIEPQDFSFQNSANMKAISQKIQFSINDIVALKKSKSRKTKTIQDPNSNKKCGHWSSEQNKRYHWFLQLHHEHFFNKHLRRTDRIFKSMATFVQTRQAEQCRSHHQKMQKKYKYFSKILMSLRLQNYNCDDVELILLDMQQKGHDISSISLLSGQQLRSINETSFSQQSSIQKIESKVPKGKILKSQISATTLPTSITNFQQLKEQQNKQPQQQGYSQFIVKNDDIDNIFNDTYQRNIDIGAFF